MKKFLNIPQRIDEDYNSIKDDIPLVSVFTTRNVLVRGMLILDEFLTVEIHATYDFKKTPTLTAVSPEGKKRKQTTRESSSPRKSQKITIKKKKQSTTPIPPPGDDRERDEVAEPTILSLILHKTTLAAEAQENISKVQEKLDEGEIEKMVEGDEDEESYESEFSDSMINDDVDDSEIEKEKKDKEIEKETNIDDVEKSDEVVKEKDIDVATGSMEFRKEKMQTPIPSPTRPSRKVSSSNKTISEELTAAVSLTTDTTSKDLSTSKRKKKSISYKTKILPGSIDGMCRRRGQICSHIKNKFITHDFFMERFKKFLIIATRNADPPKGGETWRKDILAKGIFCEWKTNSIDDEASVIINPSGRLLAEYSPNNDLVDTIPEMFIDEHALDYSSPPLYDDVDDDLFELDDFLPSPKCDSVLYEDFSEVNALPSTNNEDKVFNPGILIHENLFEVTIRVTPDKNVKKTTNASLILEDFNPPLYKLPFHKEVPGSETLLSFSSENEEKVFNPKILTSKASHLRTAPRPRNLSCLLKEQLLEPALNLTVHCCGLEFRVLNGYDQKSLDIDDRGLNCVVQTSLAMKTEA
ncbi:hypothetical protein Tco_0435329 [Tanacetum coccineum]